MKLKSFNRFDYLLLSLRALVQVVRKPLWTLRIGLRRILFTLVRDFRGPTIISPEGDPVFNVQSLINHWSLFMVGELGHEWERILRERVAPVVWDVGANIGQFGRLVKSVNPGASIHAVDPWPGMERYNEHAKEVLCYAAGDHTGTATLTRSKSGWTATSELGLYSGQQFKVNLRKLDDLWDGKRIDLLKIDVDGAEAGVLAGATEILKATSMVIIEINDRSVLELLPKDFAWHTINGSDFIGIRK